MTSSLQCLSLKELIQLTGISRSSIYDRLNPRSKRYDPEFPKPIKFGHLTRWRASEVENWIESKAQNRNQILMVS